MPTLTKLLALTCLLAALTQVSKAQNLVPNPSFEDTISCPQFYGDIDAACEYWSIFKGSPDYMHSCNPIIEADLVISKEPHTGEAYAGFINYGITTPDFGREHIGIELTSPLTIGETYFVSYFVSMAYVPSICNIATNNIGALFTTYSYYDLWTEFPNLNYSHINENSIISDTGWVKVSGSFVADSAYTYMVIGNFYDDVYTDTLNLPFTVAQQRAYYCVDDVCVTTDSLYNETWQGIVSVQENIKTTGIICYPNPANNFLNVKSDFPISSIEMFNYLGQRVLFMDKPNGHLLTIPIDQYAAGYYILRVSSSNKTHFVKLVINQNK